MVSAPPGICCMSTYPTTYLLNLTSPNLTICTVQISPAPYTSPHIYNLMYFRLKSDCQKAKVAVYRPAGHPNDPTVMKCTDTCLKRLKTPKIVV